MFAKEKNIFFETMITAEALVLKDKYNQLQKLYILWNLETNFQNLTETELLIKFQKETEGRTHPFYMSFSMTSLKYREFKYLFHNPIPMRPKLSLQQKQHDLIIRLAKNINSLRNAVHREFSSPRATIY